MCFGAAVAMQVRFGPVVGTMPETGYKFMKDGLFMTEAKGLTLRAIEKGVINDDVTKHFFTQKINSSQVPYTSRLA